MWSKKSKKCPNDDGEWPFDDHGEAQKPHTCPFAVEIDDDDSECTCCEECETQCILDI